MKKFLSIIACFILACTSLAFIGCGNKTPYEPPRRVVQSLPDKIHVEYNGNEYSVGLIFVKDGNEYYVNGKNRWHADRSEIYMKTDLSTPVCLAEDGEGWLFISAHWDGTAWILASDETEYTPANSVWHANDHNQATYTQTEYITRTGYLDVNTDTDVTDYVTVTKLENQNVVLRSSQVVECVVWDYVYDSGDVYGHYRYWFTVDTGVYIKSMSSFDRNEDVETDGTLGTDIATYYKVGDSMDVVLASKGVTRPDLRAFN